MAVERQGHRPRHPDQPLGQHLVHANQYVVDQSYRQSLHKALRVEVASQKAQGDSGSAM